MIDYCDNLGVTGDSFKTCLGTVELKRDDDTKYESEKQYSVYVEGKFLFICDQIEDNASKILFQKSENGGFSTMWLN